MQGVNVGDLVEVAWVDSYAEEGWMPAQDAVAATTSDTPLGVCHSAGYVLAVTDSWLTLTLSYSRTGSVFGYMSIPTCSITSTTVLIEHAMG